ncbi:NAD-dependent epimerase/dehydratase family protein [Singulisphaera acidiphila]|uniref:Nucleoside-diphosphate-sugar epimerase n=1 Tax=Singulisphaera acidiphila (strain ATCC BAA-1392 / DSM 18658 / VKM B-2454 / MOB10) TaxID=886293 RepID=L0DIC6_SINAD|nr:NAD(P)-dependent oxidoreductase [Singulisphaera acidiphila]AGA28615.1 nucleoside-diphosphate-sugar epimerase [Singulisphaera acidiphila DSM 18658]
MRIGVTGATGFLGRSLVANLANAGHHLRCWHRPSSSHEGLEPFQVSLTWVPGELGNDQAAQDLVAGCDAVVHSALYHPSGGFMGGEGDLIPFLETNLMGTIRLIEAARAAGVKRFVFISTCAVYDTILGDRPLDETHPLWPASHYGAHKAALEAFVRSYGQGQGYPICALRPTGIYGLAHPARKSKWFNLIAAVARGETVDCRRGGKEVHVTDVAQAVALLLAADAKAITGQAFNCCDRYVSEYEVATIARQRSGAGGEILGTPSAPKNQIVTTKLQALGMQFGGVPLLEQTIDALLAVTSSSPTV